ncbi:hypothetical protein [Nodosilinea nodulosa]|uniref:hypothetical protein n=1 Tax=Nodosilinea nodulosa TaxID=416001 RepID=UPI0012D819A4|nr:hypothetical protein [Nodosilinea nodulosa]
MGSSEIAALAARFRAVSTSKDGIKTFVIALKRAMPDPQEMTQEELAVAIGMSRSTLAALLDPSRTPKKESIPLAAYENLRRALEPIMPGESEPLSREGLIDLILKEDGATVAAGKRSLLGVEIEKQLHRNMAREGGRTYEEVEAELVKMLQILPKDGESMAKGMLSEEEAKERLQEMRCGRYTPELELETALLAAWLECDEEGNHDQRWVKWICGLMPQNYEWKGAGSRGS